MKIFGSAGRIKYEFGQDNELVHPSDLTITRDNDLAITDCGDMCVKIFDMFGMLKLRFGDERSMTLPISICTDAIGRLVL